MGCACRHAPLRCHTLPSVTRSRHREGAQGCGFAGQCRAPALLTKPFLSYPALGSGSGVYLGAQARGIIQTSPSCPRTGTKGPLRPAAHSVHRYHPLGPCTWHVVSSSLGCQSMWCPSSWGSCVQLSPRPGAESHPSQAGAEEVIRAVCWEADPSSEARLVEMSNEGAPPAHSGPLHDPLQSCSNQVKSA